MNVCAGGDDTVDSDDDGTPDACDDYADDPAKTEPGTGGCGVVDTAVYGEVNGVGLSDVLGYGALFGPVRRTTIGTPTSHGTFSLTPRRPGSSTPFANIAAVSGVSMASVGVRSTTFRWLEFVASIRTDLLTRVDWMNPADSLTPLSQRRKDQ